MPIQYTSTSTHEEEYREVYKSDSWKYSKEYITKNPVLIKMIDKRNAMNTWDNRLITILKIVFFCWLPTLLLFEAELIAAATIISLSCIIICLTLGIIAIVLESKADNLYYEIISVYEESEEFRLISTKIKRQEEKEKDDRLKAIAKDLIETYEILESTTHSKTRKIQLLKKYIERSEERRER